MLIINRLTTISFIIALSNSIHSSVGVGVGVGNNPYPYASPERIEQFAITGWYSGCTITDVITTGGRTQKEHTCANHEYLDFQQDPLYLDTTGETCYMNPLNTTIPAVYWVGPSWLRNAWGPYFSVYMMILNTDESEAEAKQLMPVDCDARGSCTCHAIQAYMNHSNNRWQEWDDWEEWRDLAVDNHTSFQATDRRQSENSIYQTREFYVNQKLVPSSSSNEECSIMYSWFQDNYSGSCFFPVNLVDTAATANPTQSPSTYSPTPLRATSSSAATISPTVSSPVSSSTMSPTAAASSSISDNTNSPSSYSTAEPSSSFTEESPPTPTATITMAPTDINTETLPSGAAAAHPRGRATFFTTATVVVLGGVVVSLVY